MNLLNYQGTIDSHQFNIIIQIMIVLIILPYSSCLALLKEGRLFYYRG